MHRFRLAVATRSLNLPLRQGIRQVSDWGSPGIQLDLRDEVPFTDFSDSAIRDLKHLLKEQEVQLASATLPLKHPLYEPAQREGRLDFVQKAMRFAAKIGAPTLTMPIGRVPASDDPNHAILFDVITDLAKLANHVGVALAVVPSRDTPDSLAEFVRSITTGPIGIDFDPAQLVMTGHDETDAYRKSYAITGHVQIRDGWRDRDGGGQEAAFGEGSVNWVELFALIAESEYSGWCTLARQQGTQIAHDLETGLACVKRMLLM